MFFRFGIRNDSTLKGIFSETSFTKRKNMGFFSKTYLTVSDNVLLDAEIFLKESRKKFLIILFQEIVRKMVKK